MSFISTAGSTDETFGDGSFGNQSISGVINSYATLNQDISSGTTSISVNDATQFDVNQTVMLHQTQQSSGNAGQYEFGVIESIPDSSTIVLKEQTINSYQSTPSSANQTNSTNTGSSTIAQVVGTPQYRDATLSGLLEAKDWDGSNGGILFLRVRGTLDCNTNIISAFASGFRGGRVNGRGNGSRGFAGESYNGIFTDGDQNNNLSGGAGDGAGGTDGVGGTSSGSGGHAVKGQDGEGGQGRGPMEGGDSVGSSSLNNIYFGGAGGRGGDNDTNALDGYLGIGNVQITSAENPFPSLSSTIDSGLGEVGGTAIPQSIGRGGGIVIIFADEIVNLNVNVRGFPATFDTGSGEMNGAGASGSVLIKSSDANITEISAQGTSFEFAVDDKRSGGASPGRVRVDAVRSSSFSTGNIDVSAIGARGNGTIQNNSNVDSGMNI
jgi:hypothetical protein